MKNKILVIGGCSGLAALAAGAYLGVCLSDRDRDDVQIQTEISTEVEETPIVEIIPETEVELESLVPSDITEESVEQTASFDTGDAYIDRTLALYDTAVVVYDPVLYLPEDTVFDDSIELLSLSEPCDCAIIKNLVYQYARDSGIATSDIVIDTDQQYGDTMYYNSVSPKNLKLHAYYSGTSYYGCITE